jgi:hypothetical protein
MMMSGKWLVAAVLAQRARRFPQSRNAQRAPMIVVAVV